MKYAVYKFEFQTGVHFGTGRLNETTYVFHADQLFSALYIEALKSGVADRFYQDVIQGKLILSDGMPYVGTDYLVPKPMIYVKTEQKFSVQGVQTRLKRNDRFEISDRVAN